MGLTHTEREHLEDVHPELLQSMWSDAPSEIFWSVPNLAFTADEALELLPRFLADAVAVKMGRPDNTDTESEVIAALFTQLRRSLHHSSRRWAMPSEIIVMTPQGPEDLLMRARQTAVSEEPLVTAARVRALLTRVHQQYERTAAHGAPPRLWPHPFEQGATLLLGLLQRHELLAGAFVVVKDEPWPAPIKPATLPAVMDWMQRLVSPFALADSDAVRQEGAGQAADLLRVALGLLSTAQAAEAKRLAWQQARSSQ